MKENWTSKKFGDVFNLQMGKTPTRNNPAYWGGENIWVSIADLKDKYIEESKEHITDIAVLESGINKVYQGTVIMSFKLTIGRAAITKCDLYTNEAIMSFVPKEKNAILSDYIYYYLKGCKWTGTNKAVMGQTLNKKTIAENIFAYPPIAEQHRIVSELDLLQSIIDKQQAQLKELDTLAQAVFYDMFGDPVENERGWKMKTLKEIASVKIGPFGSLLHTSDYIKGGVPLVNPIHMKNGRIVPDESFTISEEKRKVMQPYLLKKGDVVFARRGEIGRCAIVSEREDGYLCGTGSLFVRFKETISEMFVLYWTKSDSFVKDLVSKAKGATMLNINCNIVENLQLPIPPLPLQQAFVEKIETIEHQKAIIKQSLVETQKLFDYTMDKYFG